MPRHQTVLASLLLVITACASRGPAPEVIPSPSEVISTGSTVTTSSRTTWKFALREQKHAYHSTSYAVIREVTPATSRIDTVRLATYFTLNLNQLQTPTAISGYIDSITVERASETSTTRSRTDFTGSIIAGQLRLSLPADKPECTSPISATLGEIRPVIMTLPQTLSLASSWRDSISTATCSSIGIPTLLSIIRSYRVVGEGNYATAPVLILNRTEAIHFSGDGHQEQHQVHIEGTGTGSTRVYIDLSNGTIVGIENTQKIETSITSSGVTHQFIQDVTHKIDSTL
jgi:hypothetical protein